ncbi:MAG: UvrB/UvrC motif-containing protein [Synergistes sp.]|nr:UvrB/UvrC motif-containing protein [Synergistes sp.]
MLCENCRVNQADVHFVCVENGEKHVKHLCRHCAESRLHLDDVSNLMRMSLSIQGLAGLEDVFKNLIMPALRAGEEDIADEPKVCPHCGEVLPDYLFEDDDNRPARRNRIVVRQKKGEKKISPRVSIEDVLADLNVQMKEAARSEDYERAARLRDRIAEIKNAEETENNGITETRDSDS